MSCRTDCTLIVRIGLQPKAGEIMFWIGLFLVAGGTYTAVNKGLDSPVGIGLLAILPIAFVLSYPLMATLWVNEQVGIDGVIVDSFQFFSGVDTPSEVVVDCPNSNPPGENYSFGKAFISITVSLFAFLLLMICGALLLIAGLSIPIGILLSFGGGLLAMFSRESPKDNLALIMGLKALLAGTGLVIIIGLSFRLIHILSEAAYC